MAVQTERVDAKKTSSPNASSAYDVRDHEMYMDRTIGLFGGISLVLGTIVGVSTAP